MLGQNVSATWYNIANTGDCDSGEKNISNYAEPRSGCVSHTITVQHG